MLVSLIRCDRREYWDVLFASQIACLVGICFGVEVFFKVIKLKERIPIKLEKNHLRIKQFALAGVVSNSLILATYTIMLLILFLVC